MCVDSSLDCILSVFVSTPCPTKENNNKEYSIGYSYFDECFGINLDFDRKFYTDNDLKPQDVLTLMFSFKNVGSYKSTNLAVSETGKQDIQWESSNLNNALFN